MPIFLGNSLQLLIIFAAVLILNRILIAFEYVTGARRGVSQKKRVRQDLGSVTEERDRNRIKRQKYRSEAGSGPEEKK